MKSLVVSAMICAATVGTCAAGTSLTFPAGKPEMKQVIEDRNVTAFKRTIAFHRRNIDVLFHQFETARKEIRQSRGSHADLERDKAFFIRAYQNDMDAGVRVEASKKAIAEIEDLYVRKHAERRAYEEVRLAKLQVQLCAELKREQREFKRAKRKYADFVNAETLPLLQKAEQYFADALNLAQHADADQMTIAVR